MQGLRPPASSATRRPGQGRSCSQKSASASCKESRHGEMEPRRVSAAALLMDELDAKGADSEPSATRVAPLQSEGLEEGHR